MAKMMSVKKLGVRKSIALRILGVVTIAAVSVTTVSTAAHAKPPLGKRWPASQQVSMNEIDHGAFETLLRKRVGPIALSTRNSEMNRELPVLRS